MAHDAKRAGATDKPPKRSKIWAFLALMVLAMGVAEVSNRLFGTGGSFIAVTILLFMWVLFFIVWAIWAQRRSRNDQSK